MTFFAVNVNKGVPLVLGSSMAPTPTEIGGEFYAKRICVILSEVEVLGRLCRDKTKRRARMGAARRDLLCLTEDILNAENI